MNPHDIFAAAYILASSIAVVHAILYQKDARAALGWIGIIILSPILGPTLYFILGLNRVRERGAAFRLSHPSGGTASAKSSCSGVRGYPATPSGKLQNNLFRSLYRVGSQINQFEVTEGNAVQTLFNGDEAYPEMLASIVGAKKQVFLSTFIFKNDNIGNAFIAALSDAKNRGVDVRVLIDDFGALYSFPSVIGKLRKLQIATAQFLPIWFPWQADFINLRLHRKSLIVDGVVAFVGGMNIQSSNMVKETTSRATKDLQFRLVGPAVLQCEAVFIHDWEFAKGEKLTPSISEDSGSTGTIPIRCIADGPDSHSEKSEWMILAALAQAETSVKIMTPYFFPGEEILMALAGAAQRGVAVDIVLPKNNNLPWVQWASNTVLGQIMQFNCRVWLSPGNFTHTKLFVVDQSWTLLGSTNWDRRSLRLNFELNFECFCKAFSSKMDDHISGEMARSKLLVAEELNTRPIYRRLRDGIARLLSPLL